MEQYKITPSDALKIGAEDEKVLVLMVSFFLTPSKEKIMN
jgi:hypothetical protein